MTNVFDNFLEPNTDRSIELAAIATKHHTIRAIHRIAEQSESYYVVDGGGNFWVASNAEQAVDLAGEIAKLYTAEDYTAAYHLPCYRADSY